MEYEEYKNRMLCLVQEKLEEEAEVSFLTREKTNQTKKEGICIRKPGNNQDVVIYLQEMFQSYQMAGNEAVLDRMAENMIDIFRESEDMPGADILTDWESVKDQVRIRLVKKAWNEEKLKSWVHRDFLDFAVVLAVELWVGEDRLGSTPIKRVSLEFWGVSEEEIYQKAAENLNREDYSIALIDTYLPEAYPDGEQDMYVLRRRNKDYGAGLMLREDALSWFAKEQGSSFYILPCSVHELILMKQEEDTDVQCLKETVRIVNADTKAMKPEERLSDNIYYYDREKRKLEIVP